ncbi:MAG: hypothetical protein IPJ34_42625 [Myxococcales bacterium]|nr:hypothetical protein [Myxococcales bacterium]
MPLASMRTPVMLVPNTAHVCEPTWATSMLPTDGGSANVSVFVALSAASRSEMAMPDELMMATAHPLARGAMAKSTRGAVGTTTVEPNSVPSAEKRCSRGSEAPMARKMAAASLPFQARKLWLANGEGAGASS